MHESQSEPRAQQQSAQQQAQQPQSQQHRTRSRLAADGQTSRRPRAVAGQRAAAKRAGQPAQTGQPVQSGQPVPPDRPAQAVQQQPIATVATAEPVAPRRDDEATASAVDTDAVNADAANEATEIPAAGSAVAVSVSESDVEPDAEPGLGVGSSTRASKSVQSRGVRRAVVTAALAVALIAVVAIGAVLTIQYRDAIRTDHARTAAMAAAKRAAPVIFSYDYRHLDQDFSKAEALLTGSFHDQYAKTTQTVVKPTALQYHGVVKATVAQPADGSAAAVSVVSASPEQVVVLAFIDQSTTSTRVSGTQVDQNRVLLTLTHTPQGWLVSAVDAL